MKKIFKFKICPVSHILSRQSHFVPSVTHISTLGLSHLFIIWGKYEKWHQLKHFNTLYDIHNSILHPKIRQIVHTSSFHKVLPLVLSQMHCVYCASHTVCKHILTFNQPAGWFCWYFICHKMALNPNSSNWTPADVQLVGRYLPFLEEEIHTISILAGCKSKTGSHSISMGQ